MAKTKATKTKKGTVRPRITVDVVRDPGQGRLAVAVASAALTETRRNESKASEQLSRAYLSTDALRETLAALAPLDFDERRAVLRWSADHYGIDAAKLAHTGAA